MQSTDAYGTGVWPSNSTSPLNQVEPGAGVTRSEPLWHV